MGGEMMETPTTPVQSAYPVDVSVSYPARSSRLYALLAVLFFVKAVLLLPHYVVLYVLSLAALLVAAIGYLAVLFTGRYPRSMFEFLAGVLRWQTRVQAWLLGLTDRYPPFSLL